MAIEYYHCSEYVRKLADKLGDTARQHPQPNPYHDMQELLQELLLYRDWLNKQMEIIDSQIHLPN